jgi:hypothetical protein
VIVSPQFHGLFDIYVTLDFYLTVILAELFGKLLVRRSFIYKPSAYS